MVMRGNIGLVAPDLHIFRESQNTNFPIKNLYFLCAFHDSPLTCLSHQSQSPKLPLIPIILSCYHFPFPNSWGPLYLRPILRKISPFLNHFDFLISNLICSPLKICFLLCSSKWVGHLAPRCYFQTFYLHPLPSPPAKNLILRADSIHLVHHLLTQAITPHFSMILAPGSLPLPLFPS